MATKRFAQGTKLYMEDPATPGTYIPIAKAKDISLPSSTTDLIEVTDHDSPNGRKEYIGGLIDSDELTIGINWDAEDTSHSMVETRVGELHTFRIEFNNTGGTNGTRYTFDAIIRGFKGTAPVNGVYGADLTLKPSGDVTKTPAA